MKTSTISASKKTGRPAIGAGKPAFVRLRPDEEKRLDKWIARNAPDASRPEAIRQLIALALDSRA